jgi:aminoglycoside 3-N-acetyltransferase
MTNSDYSKSDLVSALEEIGLKDGDLAFIHNSMFHLGRLENYNSSKEVSRIVFDSFFEVLGPTGTLLVPTYTYSLCNGKSFDVKNTPSSIGTFTEFFRNQKGAVRSADPIFSVSGIGPKSKTILSDLPKSCFGEDSVYDRITKLNGKLCVIGLGLSYATYRHYAEQKMNIPARFLKYFSGKILEDGNERTETWEYFVRHLSENCYPDVEVIEKNLKKANVSNVCKKAKVGRGEILSINCTDYLELMKRELKKDPWFSVRGPPVNIE